MLVLLAPAAALLLPLGCHGHRIPVAFVPNHGTSFDFSDPPCARAARPGAGAGDVLVRYLGVSGLLIEWRDVQLMTAPFFSIVFATSRGLLRVSSAGSCQPSRMP